jgi:hypothetical protein
MKKIVLAILLASSLQSQVFDHWQPVPSRSDRDFKVAWSNAGPPIEVDVPKNGRFVKETRAYYMTTVRGKGKLTNLRENPDATVLITVEGIQDHAIWFVLMNSTSSQSDRVKFWQVGDTISLGAETILINDDRIPKIQTSEGLTRNLTRNCEGRSRASDCYVYDTNKSNKQ